MFLKESVTFLQQTNIKTTTDLHEKRKTPIFL